MLGTDVGRKDFLELLHLRPSSEPIRAKDFDYRLNVIVVNLLMPVWQQLRANRFAAVNR